MPSQLESGGNEGGINQGRKVGARDYLSCILGLVVSVQELDMLRNNIFWILALAETGSIDGDGSTSREKRIPEFLLQFLNLSLKICNDGCLFLEWSRSEQAISTKADFPRDLGRTRRVHDGGERQPGKTRDTGCDTRVSPFPPPDRRKSLDPK